MHRVQYTVVTVRSRLSSVCPPVSWASSLPAQLHPMLFDGRISILRGLGVVCGLLELFSELKVSHPRVSQLARTDIPRSVFRDRDSASSVSLSLPPSFDDSLDISPFLARVSGQEEAGRVYTPILRQPGSTRHPPRQGGKRQGGCTHQYSGTARHDVG